jgi:ribosomal protein S18 acetylase RimI-like enzyme
LVQVLDAFQTASAPVAANLIREYMATTAEEQHVSVDELPHPIDEEVANLRSYYRPPGTVLIASHEGLTVGCVALQVVSARVAEVHRLYVREAHRRCGAASALMEHVHSLARANGIESLILDVLPTREAVIAWYRRLGYVDTEPFGEQAQPMVYLRCELSRAP